MDIPLEGYGGIWLTGKPFYFNLKCLVIGLIAACIYALPKQAGLGNIYMMALIFSLSYIGLSIYDNIYNCEAHMLSGSLSINSIFKPQNVRERELPPGVALAQDQEKAYRQAVYLTHLAVLAPLIIISSGIAIQAQKREFNRLGTPSDSRSYGIHPVVLGLGFLAFFYHSARIFYPRDACNFQPTQ